MTNQTEAAQAPQPAAPCLKVSRRAKLVLGLVGAAGCVSLYWLPPPELPGVSEQLLRLAQPIQPLLLLLGALFLGARYAPRVGTGAPWLEALLAGRTPASRGAGSVGRVAGICALLGIAAALLPLLVWPLIAPSLPATFVAASKTHGPPFAVRLLYGGITEELLVRWGLLSWFLWLLRPRGEKLGTRPSRAATWTAAIIVALLFGAAHLPMAASLAGGLSPALVAWVIGGNFPLGLAAGVAFERHGIESAVLMHMTAGAALGVGALFS